jgi:TldD protein
MTPARASVSRAVWLTLGIVLAPAPAVAQDTAQPVSPWVASIQAEVERAKSLELPGMPRPHHIVVTVLGEDESFVEATLGAVVKQDQDRARALKVEVRVGDPTFDSSNFIGTAEEPIVVVPAPIEDDSSALRRTLWLAVDSAYKSATGTYEAKRAHKEAMAHEQDRLADFTTAPVERFRSPPVSGLPPIAAYAALARTASAVFAKHPGVHRSLVRIVAQTRTRTLVDSAGTTIEDGAALLRVEIVARTQAEDGMVLADHVSFASRRLDDLPSEDVLVRHAEDLATRLDRMREAAVVQDYAGPVLFEGRAAPQLFRYLFADELSATPLPEPSAGAEGATSFLSTRVGWRVLPLGFDVTDDPTVDRIADLPLLGGYGFDDQGVRAQSVRLVEDGVLKTLLSSRTPSKSVALSNGHGRAGVMGDARGRAANLWVSSRAGLSATALRAKLVELAKKEGLDQGIVVTELDEPAWTDHAMPVEGRGGGGVVLPRPTEAYRIRAGGKVELVRGVSLHGLRPRDLRHVLAAGREVSAYSYWASASPVRAAGNFGGEIPTTIVAPSVLLPDVDVMAPVPPHPLPPLAPR